MDELELSKFFGVACAAMLAFVGLSQVSNAIVSMDHLDEPAYAIEVAESDDAGEEAPEPVSVAALMAEADAASGQKVFKKCSACHNQAEGAGSKAGPNLWGVMGRDIASIDGFSYSSSLAEKEGGWTWEAMNAFLTKPKSYASNTKMNFTGLKDGDRADVMAWLNSQGDAPIDPPTE